MRKLKVAIGAIALATSASASEVDPGTFTITSTNMQVHNGKITVHEDDPMTPVDESDVLYVTSPDWDGSGNTITQAYDYNATTDRYVNRANPNKSIAV